MPIRGPVSRVYYVPPPGEPPNIFAATMAGFLQTRTPWTMDLFKARLAAMSPTNRSFALLEERRLDQAEQEMYHETYRSQLSAGSDRMNALKSAHNARLNFHATAVAAGSRVEVAGIDYHKMTRSTAMRAQADLGLGYLAADTADLDRDQEAYLAGQLKGPLLDLMGPIKTTWDAALKAAAKTGEVGGLERAAEQMRQSVEQLAAFGKTETEQRAVQAHAHQHAMRGLDVALAGLPEGSGGNDVKVEYRNRLSSILGSFDPIAPPPPRELRKTNIYAPRLPSGNANDAYIKNVLQQSGLEMQEAIGYGGPSGGGSFSRSGAYPAPPGAVSVPGLGTAPGVAGVPAGAGVPAFPPGRQRGPRISDIEQGPGLGGLFDPAPVGSPQRAGDTYNASQRLREGPPTTRTPPPPPPPPRLSPEAIKEMIKRQSGLKSFDVPVEQKEINAAKRAQVYGRAGKDYEYQDPVQVGTDELDALLNTAPPEEGELLYQGTSAPPLHLAPRVIAPAAAPATPPGELGLENLAGMQPGELYKWLVQQQLDPDQRERAAYLAEAKREWEEDLAQRVDAGFSQDIGMDSLAARPGRPITLRELRELSQNMPTPEYKGWLPPPPVRTQEEEIRARLLSDERLNMLLP